MSSQPLPPAWVERLFGRFAAAFGSLKVGTMWPADQHETVKGMWADQLGRFTPETIRMALQAVIDSGREWPPTLPEFVEQCRQAALGRRSASPALPGPAADRAAAAEQLRLIADQAAAVVRVKPGREWAQRILSRVASGDSVSLTVLAMATTAANAQLAREPGSDDE